METLSSEVLVVGAGLAGFSAAVRAAEQGAKVLLIDKSGLGMQIAEELAKRFPGKAEGVDFTNATKELWAVELKVRMQRGEVPIPLDRDLSYQIHSLKRKVTMAKNAVFDTAGNEKHHADKFWSLALAVWAARPADVTEPRVRWVR